MEKLLAMYNIFLRNLTIFCTFMVFVFSQTTHSVNVGGDGNNSFSPSNLDIEVGDTVEWVNLGGSHNVDGSKETYPDNPVSFYCGAATNDLWTYCFTF